MNRNRCACDANAMKMQFSVERVVVFCVDGARRETVRKKHNRLNLKMTYWSPLPISCVNIMGMRRGILLDYYKAVHPFINDSGLTPSLLHFHKKILLICLLFTLDFPFTSSFHV